MEKCSPFPEIQLEMFLSKAKKSYVKFSYIKLTNHYTNIIVFLEKGVQGRAGRTGQPSQVREMRGNLTIKKNCSDTDPKSP